MIQSWALGLEWKCAKVFWERFSSLIKDRKIEETLDIVMERGDAWSCGSHLATMGAELRIKVNMLKMSEQKEGRVRGLYYNVELLPQLWDLLP